MAWGDLFDKRCYLGEAREAYEALETADRLTVDAAIIKRLSREAYEAALRIYEIRGYKKIHIMYGIFDGLITEYTESDRIMMLRGYMIGFGKTGRHTLALAREELADRSDYYQSVMLDETQARAIAAQGDIQPSSFTGVRSQLMPMAPVISYMMKAMRSEYDSMRGGLVAQYS